jgi:flagellar basal-body rod modification protein FlgD
MAVTSASNPVSPAIAALMAPDPSATPVVSGPKQLGQADFLQLLTTQMQNQDPLKPMDNQEFIAQLAQFSQLEASSEQTKLLQQNLDQQSLAIEVGMARLIGQQVKLADGLVELTGTPPAVMQYSLDRNAAGVNVTVTSDSGVMVRTLNQGPQTSGAHDIKWDGKDDVGNALPPGAYHFAVTALDSQGQTVNATLSSAATITGVRPDSNGPLFLVGDQTVDPKNILEFY